MDGIIEFFENYWAFILEQVEHDAYKVLLTDVRVIVTAVLILGIAFLVHSRRFMLIFTACYTMALLACYTFPQGPQGDYEMPNKMNLLFFMLGVVGIVVSSIYFLFIKEK